MYFCEKLENKFEGCGEINSCLLVSSMEKFSLGGGEEKISTKQKGGWMTYTHKKEHEMKNISLHPLTYFPYSHLN